MSTTAITYNRLPLGLFVPREYRGSARTPDHLAPAHLAERAYAAELAHAERSARLRDREAVLAQGSPR